MWPRYGLSSMGTQFNLYISVSKITAQFRIYNISKIIVLHFNISTALPFCKLILANQNKTNLLHVWKLCHNLSKLLSKPCTFPLSISLFNVAGFKDILWASLHTHYHANIFSHKITLKGINCVVTSEMYSVYWPQLLVTLINGGTVAYNMANRKYEFLPIV